jgi:hypothetical protein
MKRSKRGRSQHGLNLSCTDVDQILVQCSAQDFLRHDAKIFASLHGAQSRRSRFLRACCCVQVQGLQPTTLATGGF